MFERYTEKARRAIFFGRYEASQVGSPSIESEHLLLGLLRENKGVIERVLNAHAPVEPIRKQIEAQTVIREKISPSVDLPLSNECKRILAYALEEADKLSHKFIGTEHLFLGVLREQGCFAAKLLNERGVTLAAAREQIAAGPPPQFGEAPKSPGLPAGYSSHRLLYNRPAETLILELSRAGGPVLATRIFVRHKNAETYEPVGSPGEEVWYESPVTCETLPIVVFNSMKWEKGRKEGDWGGVYSYNLLTKELALRISPEKLRFSGLHGRLSIVRLVGMSEDGGTIYVKIAIEMAVSGGRVVHYYLASVDLGDQDVRLLSRLIDTFY